MDKTEVPNPEELSKIREEYKAPVVIDDKNKGADDKSKTTPIVEDKQKGGTASQEEPKGKVEVQVVEEVKPQVTAESLSDEELIAQLEKRGKKIATETLSPEEQKRQQEIEEVEKLKFAVENNLISQEGYLEAKAILKSEGSDLTKKEFTKLYKSENKDASKDEIDSAYDDYYFVQKNISVKDKRLKENDLGDKELEEFDVEKPKWEERLVKLGEKRRVTETERIKESAKQTLEYIDSAFSKRKEIIAKANEYSKVADKVVSEIDFNALPVTYKFGTKEKSKEIKAIVKLDDEAKADVINYVNTDLAQLIVHTPKFNDKEEISKQINKYIKEKYDNQVGESLYTSGYSSGINDGKIGGSAPHVVATSTGEDQIVSELEKSVDQRLDKKNIFI